jgi:hypothetical protein
VTVILSAHNIARPLVLDVPRPRDSVLQLVGFIPQKPGTAGVLTFNYATTLEEAGAENQILSIPCDFANRGVARPGVSLVVSEVPRGMILTALYQVIKT